jgi:hypothetical protein
LTGPINLPSGFLSIGNYAFGNCSGLQGISIPDSTEYIGNNAFLYCSSLSNVHLPDNAAYTEIQNSTFYGCSNLGTIEINPQITVIGPSAFLGAHLNSLTLHEGLTEISDSAFFSTGLTSVTIPSTVTYIGAAAFQGTADTVYIMTDDVITIADPANGYSFAKTGPIYVKKTLKADFSASEYWTDYTILGFIEVTFDGNGGNPMPTIIVTEDNAVLSDANKDGAAFGGWYFDNGTFLNPYDFASVPSNTVTVYAKWI